MYAQEGSIESRGLKRADEFRQLPERHRLRRGKAFLDFLACEGGGKDIVLHRFGFFQPFAQENVTKYPLPAIERSAGSIDPANKIIILTEKKREHSGQFPFGKIDSVRMHDNV